MDVRQATLSGSYEAIPYPISIKIGHFRYADGRVTLDGVSGPVGLSSFSELTASLSYRGPRHSGISTAKVSVDVAQAKGL